MPRSQASFQLFYDSTSWPTAGPPANRCFANGTAAGNASRKSTGPKPTWTDLPQGLFVDSESLTVHHEFDLANATAGPLKNGEITGRPVAYAPGTGIRKRVPSGVTSQNSTPDGTWNKVFGAPA